MSDFTLDPNFTDADAFYQKLIALHDGLSEEDSHRLNAKLVLILANQIGDNRILEEALASARGISPSQGN